MLLKTLCSKQFLIFSILISQVCANEVMALYPTPPIDGDVRAVFALDMVKMALSKQDASWVARLNGPAMERGRMEAELEKGTLINVLMLPKNAEYDKRFLKVRHNLDKGLLGYRVALVHQDNLNLFQSVETLKQLRELTVCASRKWSITKLFRSNSLPTLEQSEFRHNFLHLNLKHCDYLSRGLSEVLLEYSEYADEFKSIAIDPYITISSDQGYYLYVSPRHPDLHAALELGFEKANKDGSFERLFQQYYGATLTSLNFHERRVIKLEPFPKPPK